MSYKKFLSFVAITTLASSIILTGCGTSSVTSATSSTVTATEATASDDCTEASEYFTERDIDYSYDESSATKVTLSDDETYTISEEGVYIFSGSVNNAQIVVDANETDKVQIVLDGLTMTNESTACIYGLNADKIFITTADGSTNSLSVTDEYVAIDDNNIDGVIFSKTDVTLNGGGTLNIEGASGHGVVSKDDLKVTCGNYNISVAKKGLEGKESVRIGGGSINITECYEGIESQEIILVDGEINITASDDGINAVSADDSSDNDGMAADGVSSITILGGTLYINASGDGIDSNNDLTISGGT
ncbi:MAG: carbohydrate-binding domain-containing protein, partial [Lachnospiraceae bacterium]|nr:carbohydrate-binding domain-containing protein [Lachnospiraceae bacterium]